MAKEDKDKGTRDWISAALDACKDAKVCFSEPALNTLATLAILHGNAPFDNNDEQRGYYPAVSIDWLREIRNVVLTDAKVMGEFNDQDIARLEGTAFRIIEPRTIHVEAGWRVLRYMPWLTEAPKKLNFSNTAHSVATWACCSALMQGVEDVMAEAMSILNATCSPEVVEQAKPLLDKTMNDVGHMFIDILRDRKEPGAADIQRLLYELRPKSETPSFGLG